MKKRKIIIASSLEPSGMTWLVNCLLSLGYLCYPAANRDKVWHQVDKNTYSLSAEFDYLKKWIPILNLKLDFDFDPIIEFEWTHSWPTVQDSNFEAILFVRDPRSSLYSRYKREFPEVDYDSFLNSLEPNSLLGKHQYLNLFYNSWLLHRNLYIEKFENYKTDDVFTLSKILDKIAIKTTNEGILRACADSTFEMAAKFEKIYLSNSSIVNTPKMNRAGSANEWRSESLDKSNHMIAYFCTNSMLKLGYHSIAENGKDEYLQIPKKFLLGKVVNMNEVTMTNHPKFEYDLYGFRKIFREIYIDKFHDQREGVILLSNLSKNLPRSINRLFVRIIFISSTIRYMFYRSVLKKE
jgi:hypothetical protein